MVHPSQGVGLRLEAWFQVQSDQIKQSIERLSAKQALHGATHRPLRWMRGAAVLLAAVGHVHIKVNKAIFVRGKHGTLP